jgi:hypothetical protein
MPTDQGTSTVVSSYPRVDGDVGPSVKILGVLIRKDGCLRVDSDAGNYLLLWPESFSFVESSGRVTAVINPGGEQLMVGGRVIMTGGPTDPPVSQIGDCDSPAWHVTSLGSG